MFLMTSASTSTTATKPSIAPSDCPVVYGGDQNVSLSYS